MTPIEPERSTLDVHGDVLTDLRDRLARTRWWDEVPASGRRYGSDLAFVRRRTER